MERMENIPLKSQTWVSRDSIINKVALLTFGNLKVYFRKQRYRPPETENPNN